MSIQKVGMRPFALMRRLDRRYKMDCIQLSYAESSFGEFEMTEMNRIKRPTKKA